MKSLLAELVKNTPVILDGGWGTQIYAAGLPAGECPDVWNLSHSECITNLARSYVDAGSRIILTNTFRANRIALVSYNVADKVVEINRAGVGISRVAAGNRARVFGSIGPCGKMLVTREVTEGEVLSAFAEQAGALADAGADGIVIETMTNLAEAKLALAAALTTGLPIVACMVFDSGKEKDRTMMGETPEQVAAELSAAGADVIGANCGVGIEKYIPICRRLRASTDKPLWIKPNAGLPEFADGKVMYRTEPATFAAQATVLAAQGADFIGGCCGTTPEFIQAIIRAVGQA